MVDEGHLPAPLHVRMPETLLTLRLPRPPDQRLLLRNPNQHHPPVTTLGGRGVKQRPRNRLLVLTLG
jgi:hypothetical protein